jgi:N-acetylmuramoyl-L-alanine amidase
MFSSNSKKVTKLHKKQPEGLSLAVLKAPDIPSVLIETGFISNPKDEKDLNSSIHQQKLAKAIYTAVDSYFIRNSPEGTLLAATKVIDHNIIRGESLSVVAHRYKVSVDHLKKTNNLTSNTVRVGQTLKIKRVN